jgi:hypothetical protein
MAASPTAPSAAPLTGSPRRSRFVTFAGVMFLMASAFNLLDGVVALTKDEYYRKAELLIGDLSAWGLWWLIVGVLQLGAGIAILRRKDWSLIPGIMLAGLNALTQLIFIRTSPAWSVSIMVVDGLIIYGLTTRLDEFV